MAELSQLLGSALASHRAGDMPAAARKYEQILQQHPEQPDALNLLAIIALEDGDATQAQALLRRAIAVSGDVPQFHCHLGNALTAAGDFAAAVPAYAKAVSLNPNYLEAHSSLGFARMQLGETEQAIACFNAALGIDPGYSFALNNLGDARVLEGDLEAAVDAYRRAIAAAPGMADVHTKLGAILRDLGHLPEAVEQLWAAIDTDEHNLAAYRTLGSLLRFSQPAAYDPELEKGLLGFFDTTGVDHGDVAEFATALVKLKYAGDDLPGKQRDPAFVVDTLLADPLLCALLTHTANGDPELELLLSAARRWLLLECANDTDRWLAQMSVLAQQIHINEFVLSVEADERAHIDALRIALESRADWSSIAETDLQRRLVLFSMYEPMAQLAIAARLAQVAPASWAACVRPLLRRSLLEPMEEAALAADIPVCGAATDTVSLAVKAQYEESPYPRWLTPAYRNPGNLYDIVKGMFPGFEAPAVLKGRTRVLVVGCGTGHHPISIALRYENAEVVATDISRRSLAYGVRMARELGVGNVRFMENDLLALSELEGEFHVIECVGVLHHTASIAEGVRALLGKLHRDGLLKVGLYSEAARAPVALARKRISALGLTAAADDIRRFRQTALAASEDDALRQILDFGDFYTLSNCRDLLFHVHEQNVTIAAIDALVAATGLRFLGFEIADPRLGEAYRQRFPEDRAMDALPCWQAIEEDDPGAFAGLYQFWCTRAAPQ